MALLKDQILGEVCGIKGSGDRFASVLTCFTPAQLTLGRQSVTLVWREGTTAVGQKRSCQGVAEGGWAKEGRVGLGKRFCIESQ